jgi:hypothetical protein
MKHHYHVTIADIYGLFESWCIESALTLEALTDRLAPEITVGTTLTVELAD